MFTAAVLCHTYEFLDIVGHAVAYFQQIYCNYGTKENVNHRNLEILWLEMKNFWHDFERRCGIDKERSLRFDLIHGYAGGSDRYSLSLSIM